MSLTIMILTFHLVAIEAPRPKMKGERFFSLFSSHGPRLNLVVVRLGLASCTSGYDTFLLILLCTVPWAWGVRSVHHTIIRRHRA